LGCVIIVIRKFSSPREEALEIAIQTRKNILESKRDVVSTLRSCLVIASNLNKKDDIKWLRLELSGYSKDFPRYRIVRCPVQNKYGTLLDFYNLKVYYNVHELSAILQTESRNISISKEEERDKYIILQEHTIRSILDNIMDKSLFFLNDIISELQYGGIVEYLMEEIRKNTDEKLATLDKIIKDESQSLYVNLTSTNPADWNKVAHSCRKMLKLLADKISPPREDSYKMKDGREFEMGDPHFINRLCAFFDQKSSGGERKFLLANIRYLEDYLREIVSYSQMGEHKPSIEKYHANMIAIHTYLIISEILKHYPNQNEIQVN